MKKPTKEELVMLSEMMCKAAHHFEGVAKKEREENGGSQLYIDLLDLLSMDPELAHKKLQEMCADWVLENWDELINCN